MKWNINQMMNHDRWNTISYVNFYWHSIGMVTFNVAQHLINEPEVNTNSLPVKCADENTEWMINDDEIWVLEHWASSNKKKLIIKFWIGTVQKGRIGCLNCRVVHTRYKKSIFLFFFFLSGYASRALKLHVTFVRKY